MNNYGSFPICCVSLKNKSPIRLGVHITDISRLVGLVQKYNIFSSIFKHKS